MSLFEQAGDGITENSPDEVNSKQKAVSVTAHTRKPKRTLEELCANIPEEEIILDLPEQEKYTADGRPLKCIGTDDVRIELVREPSRVYKRVYRCRVYADPRAEAETEKADIRRPHVPAPLLPGNYVSASVVTDIVVKKYTGAAGFLAQFLRCGSLSAYNENTCNTPSLLFSPDLFYIVDLFNCVCCSVLVVQTKDIRDG